MRKIVIVFLGLFVAGWSWFACSQPAAPPEKGIAQKLLAQVDSFALICRELRSVTDSSAPGAAMSADQATQVQALFLRARILYKRWEWAAEYFDPTAARAVNGPPVPEVEPMEPRIEPSGLQLIEQYLFPSPDTAKRSAIDQQCAILIAACHRYESHFTQIDILDWQVFDAAKLEVFRVMTLGITGFDAPLTLHSMEESAAALQSLDAVLAHYPEARPPAEAQSSAKSQPPAGAQSRFGAQPAAGPRPPTTRERFSAAAQYLSAHPDFNRFDRAAFITGYANPLTRSISDQESALHLPVIRYNRLLDQNARTLFDSGAFNVNAYSPEPGAFTSPAKIALGRRLFTDASLSATGTRSCQSCHQPEKAFTDGLVRNTVLGRNDPLPRNTPTLLNAALQPAQFYDMRVATLEDQSRSVVQNKAEMHGSMALSTQRLWQDTGYRRLFAAAYPRKDRESIDTFEIMNAIGSYVRSLVALDSRFDDYMRGDSAALGAAEIRGFNLFMGKARCGTCHYMPVFNGALPPRFVKLDAEIIGVPQTADGKKLDADPGRYAILPDTCFRHAFKTPTVRNAARTAPYMHNGVFTTLGQVIDFYDQGGGAGLGFAVPNQTLPFDKLHLSPDEKSSLIAFITSLDSRR